MFHRLDAESKEKIVRKLRNALEHRSEVLLAVLHGSFLQSNEPFRDVDIAVYLAPETDDLAVAADLEIELERATNYPVDIQVLNDAPAWFTVKVLSEGKVLVERVLLLREKLLLKALDEIETLRFHEELQAKRC